MKNFYQFSNMFKGFDNIKKLRKIYTGRRIKLIHMNDEYTKLKPGDKGTCIGVDDTGNLLMNWDSGSSLSIIPEVDKFEIVSN